MPDKRKITVISLIVSALLLWVTLVFAGQAATVTHLSGPLAVSSSDGTIIAVLIGSKINEGDTVITEKRTYARLKFDDGSEVILKPGSQFKVEKFSFDQEKPSNDATALRLIKGGLRTVTGQIGKRGNQESYRMNTPTATIGIRGTIYDVQYCQDDSCGSVRTGLYLTVTDGNVIVTNIAGVPTSLQVKAGQYVYVQSPLTPPMVLPTRPNIPFNPPPSMSGSASENNNSAGKSAGATDCQVR